ncbi:MAG TPA: hypothetical protein VLF41_00560 [Candidatus Nanoarchaeia archaeon]|nr:hypothetical protein [Candidatus Nanoarchaeia archaeon]
MQELQELLKICEAIEAEDEQTGRDPRCWQHKPTELELLFMVASVQLWGESLRLHAQSTDCWLEWRRQQWVATHGSDIRDGFVRGVLLCYDYLMDDKDQPRFSPHAAIEIEEEDGRRWLVPLFRLYLPKCERREEPPSVDYSDLVPLQI